MNARKNDVKSELSPKLLCDISKCANIVQEPKPVVLEFVGEVEQIWPNV